MYKKYVYIVFAILILMISWEGQKNEAVVAAEGTIPDEAIRLRILANSDDPQDQWLKRQIRDEVVESIGQWTGQLDDLATARRVIVERLPEIKQLAERIVRKHGFPYRVDVDFGQVPFPTKLYGQTVYPAGDYEAVRIAIGEGSGANWWCVLFPPLCFVDMSNADAVAAAQQTEEKREVKAGEQSSLSTDSDQVEVRFFLIDWLLSLFDRLIATFA
ncbi:stage II sporulation protein R [Numidum massiliense]|uniref:stage II sporulation protein R n=1 Tax=Numidum massiliense TaxID=1522315 RepID=UPI0006D5A1D9|nr:stage II sporulation protein R [Numidum massiliense]